MGLLDAIVGRSFSNEEAGRVVTFRVNGRYRAYVVRSESEELKIRAFLKMHSFAELLLRLVALLLTVGWLVVLGDTSVGSARFLRIGAVFAGMYLFAVALPYVSLSRTYKRELLGFVSVEDQVAVSRRNAGQRFWVFMVAFLVLAIGFIFYLMWANWLG
jgi:hypothetical protein